MRGDTPQQITELGQRFADPQQRGDAEGLESVLAGDFKLVGPLGFVLDKEQWIAAPLRGAAGVELRWDEVDVRDYGDNAVAIGHQSQEATCQDPGGR